eukprot:jgi/Pico_ML_1/52731/g3397.t2
MGEGQATPVLLLSGFLGAGKTTTLRYWIQNQRGLKLGCVVNDVASVNIDAKLIRRTHDAATSTLDLADTVELDNGCACCSITDELFDAIENLCYLADSRKQRFDWIVIEASGVAEPQNVRDLFQNAQEDKLPVSKMAYLDRIVTVVDASAFGEHYASKQMLVEKPELGEGGGRRPVVDLLIEQVECADFVLINKADRHLEIKDVGNWWDAVERSEWPTDQEAQKSILNDFSKDESIGDRRQELVFIGIGMEQATIESSLDQALLSDEELGEYKEYWTC